MRQFQRLATSHARLICMSRHWSAMRDFIPPDVRVTHVSGFDSVNKAMNGDRPAYTVSTDTYRATKLAIEHLVGLGHRRIGYGDAGHWVDGEIPLQPGSEIMVNAPDAVEPGDPLQAWIPPNVHFA